MVIKKISPLSAAKMMGILYALVGIFVGIITGTISTLGATTFAEEVPISNGPGLFETVGIFAIIVIPIVYGILGFISGAIMALTYNLCAKIVGGLEIQTENKSSQTVSTEVAPKA